MMDDDVMPVFHSDGVHDDAPAIQALFDGKAVLYNGDVYTGRVPYSGGVMFIGSPFTIPQGAGLRDILITQHIPIVQLAPIWPDDEAAHDPREETAR